MQPALYDEHYSAACPFCKIIHAEQAALIVFEDQDTLAFLDQRPLFPGHTLLVPCWHIQTMVDLPDPLVEPLFKNARLLAKAVETALQAEGTFMAINNKVSQSVPHLHIHIVPRHKSDGLKGFFWPRTAYKDEQEMLDIQASIRAEINRIQAEK
ncbi:MAG: HIT family protein [Anaerolineaceae bacterium]|nr:HIT family protein [Anaerolineaceae bacterium]